MSNVSPHRRSGESANDPSNAEPVDDTGDDNLDQPEAEAADELSEETGIDLTDASELDADNVPADEEFDRVMQAPD